MTFFLFSLALSLSFWTSKTQLKSPAENAEEKMSKDITTKTKAREREREIEERREREGEKDIERVGEIKSVCEREREGEGVGECV